MYGGPSQNFVYADVDGHIGYQLPGYVPIRSDPGDRGDRPVQGSTGDGEWLDRIPFEQGERRLDAPDPRELGDVALQLLLARLALRDVLEDDEQPCTPSSVSNGAAV